MRGWGASLPVITAPDRRRRQAHIPERDRQRERGRDMGGCRKEGQAEGVEVGREGGREGGRADETSDMCAPAPPKRASLLSRPSLSRTEEGRV